MPSHVNRLNALMSMENDDMIQSEEIDDRTRKNLIYNMRVVEVARRA
jgi:hypothetical protein